MQCDTVMRKIYLIGVVVISLILIPATIVRFSDDNDHTLDKSDFAGSNVTKGENKNIRNTVKKNIKSKIDDNSYTQRIRTELHDVKYDVNDENYIKFLKEDLQDIKKLNDSERRVAVIKLSHTMMDLLFASFKNDPTLNSHIGAFIGILDSEGFVADDNFGGISDMIVTSLSNHDSSFAESYLNFMLSKLEGDVTVKKSITTNVCAGLIAEKNYLAWKNNLVIDGQLLPSLATQVEDKIISKALNDYTLGYESSSTASNAIRSFLSAESKLIDNRAVANKITSAIYSADPEIYCNALLQAAPSKNRDILIYNMLLRANRNDKPIADEWLKEIQDDKLRAAALNDYNKKPSLNLRYEN